MLVVSATDNENNRWKKNATKTKTEVTQAVAKVLELNDFVVCLNQNFYK